MTSASLIHYPSDSRAQAMWAFDHANEHAVLSAQMNAPSVFNLARYLLDPVPPTALNGTDVWDQNHQFAHDDAANWYGVQPSLRLTDVNSQRQGDFQMFLFFNATEHAALSGAALLANS